MPATPSPIDEIFIQNFKFFPKLDDPIKLDGKHWLLYGENGSGKSSIYWALYTLLECANKEDVTEIKKYFKYDDPERLTNINLDFGTPEWVAPYIKVKLKDGTEFEVSESVTAINTNVEAKESNYSSDFVNYRNLLSLYNFAHSDEIDVFSFFEYAVFPYVKFTPVTYWHRDPIGAIGALTTESANDILGFVKQGPQKNVPNRLGRPRFPKRGEPSYSEYKNIVDGFRGDLTRLLTYINTEGNPILKTQLGYDLTFKLELVEQPAFRGSRQRQTSFTITEQRFEPPRYLIKLSIPEYNGRANVVYRPHSFLNEAKLTAIGLALRLAVLKKSLESGNPKLKILVLDDLLISLDMSNRDKVLSLIFDNYLDTHQLLIMTHDVVFFEFAKLFINQKSSVNDWKISEMYGGINTSNNPYPVIIPGELGYYEKAKKYFAAHDYTTCSLYIRKELERLVSERVPDEFIQDVSGKFKDLQVLWTKCEERYHNLGHPIPLNIKNSFAQTKLMLLNPQAHHNYTRPVYKLEIEKAIQLIEDIRANCPIPAATILLTKGMILRYKHPDVGHDYSVDFELLSDFKTDGLFGAVSTVVPRCKILTWQYRGNEFWDFRTSAVGAPSQPVKSLTQVKDVLTGGVFVTLPISEDMFIDNTILLNGLWTLKEIIDKSGAII